MKKLCCCFFKPAYIDLSKGGEQVSEKVEAKNEQKKPNEQKVVEEKKKEPTIGNLGITQPQKTEVKTENPTETSTLKK